MSVLFADLVGFTEMSNGMSAEKLVDMLDAFFSAFDAITRNAGLEKIKTIGDCYMLVGGVPEPRSDHAIAIVNVASGMLTALQDINLKHGTQLQVRIGINSGPVVAGAIGMHKFTYDLWGNTVNIASRMESTGQTGRVHVSASTAQQLRHHFELQPRGEVTFKGIGTVETFFVAAPQSPKVMLTTDRIPFI